MFRKNKFADPEDEIEYDIKQHEFALFFKYHNQLYLLTIGIN